MVAGGSPADYWCSTPRIVAAVLKARCDRDEGLWKQAMSAAWTNAALTRASEMPPLDELIGDNERPEMSDAQIGHNIALWGAVIDQQFGGD